MEEVTQFPGQGDEALMEEAEEALGNSQDHQDKGEALGVGDVWLD